MTRNQRAEMDAEMMIAEGVQPDRVARIVAEDYGIPYGAAREITDHAKRIALPTIELEPAD
jgi:hypothetical protein